MKKLGWMTAGLAGLMMLSGCGDSKTETPPPGPKDGGANTTTTPAGGTETAAKPKADMAKFTETVAGTVTFDGEAPVMKKIMISGDTFCEEHNKGDDAAKKQDLVVDPTSKGVKDAFIYVKSGPVLDYSYDVPAALEIDQQGCMYHPHVSGVLAKQKIKVGSADDTKHNVHWQSKLNGDFNQSSSKGSFVEVETKRPELGSHFKCDIHSWMQAYVCVSATPIFAVTDKDGKFTLPKLPAGDYEIGVWQQECAEQSMKVKVEAGKAATVDFKLKAK